MRICIFGAGAVGGSVAVRLADAGHDVCVVARGQTLVAIRANGLTLHVGGQTLNQRVRASERAADLGPQDVVIATLKANSLAILATEVRPLLDEETPVVFAQNGIPWWYTIGLPALKSPYPDLSMLDPRGALARAFEPRRIVGAIVATPNTVISPGVILNASAQNRLAIARIDGEPSTRVVELRAALAAASIESPVVADIRREVWQKLTSNLVSATAVLLEEPTQAMLSDPAMAGIALALVTETAAIARAYGIDIKPALPVLPPGKKSSILQDYESGRAMEVDAQLMAPLAFAQSANVKAPTLQAIAALIAYRARQKGLYK